LKRKGFILIFAGLLISSLICAGFFSSGVFAQEDAQINKAATKGTMEENPGSVELENLTSAQDLVRYGRENKSPMALLTAAEILGTVPYLTGEEEKVETKEIEGNPGDAEVIHKDEQVASDPVSLIEEAKAMSGNDAHIVALGDELLKKMEGITPPSKGEIDGPWWYEDNWIAGYSTDTWHFVFYGEEPAELQVVSRYYEDDLDVFVYDENDHFIVSDESTCSDAYVYWEPVWTGDFYVDVKNCNRCDTCYDLWTN